MRKRPEPESDQIKLPALTAQLETLEGYLMEREIAFLRTVKIRAAYDANDPEAAILLGRESFQIVRNGGEHARRNILELVGQVMKSGDYHNAADLSPQDLWERSASIKSEKHKLVVQLLIFESEGIAEYCQSDSNTLLPKTRVNGIREAVERTTLKLRSVRKTGNYNELDTYLSEHRGDLVFHPVPERKDAVQGQLIETEASVPDRSAPEVERTDPPGVVVGMEALAPFANLTGAGRTGHQAWQSNRELFNQARDAYLALTTRVRTEIFQQNAGVGRDVLNQMRGERLRNVPEWRTVLNAHREARVISARFAETIAAAVGGEIKLADGGSFHGHLDDVVSDTLKMPEGKRLGSSLAGAFGACVSFFNQADHLANPQGIRLLRYEILEQMTGARDRLELEVFSNSDFKDITMVKYRKAELAPHASDSGIPITARIGQPTDISGTMPFHEAWMLAKNQVETARIAYLGFAPEFRKQRERELATLNYKDRKLQIQFEMRRSPEWRAVKGSVHAVRSLSVALAGNIIASASGHLTNLAGEPFSDQPGEYLSPVPSLPQETTLDPILQAGLTASIKFKNRVDDIFGMTPVPRSTTHLERLPLLEQAMIDFESKVLSHKELRERPVSLENLSRSDANLPALPQTRTRAATQR
jgi:hypothetical protein